MIEMKDLKKLIMEHQFLLVKSRKTRNNNAINALTIFMTSILSGKSLKLDLQIRLRSSYKRQNDRPNTESPKMPVETKVHVQKICFSVVCNEYVHQPLSYPTTKQKIIKQPLICNPRSHSKVRGSFAHPIVLFLAPTSPLLRGTIDYTRYGYLRENLHLMLLVSLL